MWEGPDLHGRHGVNGGREQGEGSQRHSDRSIHDEGEEVHHRQFLLLLSRPIRELFLPPAATGAGRVRGAGAAD